MLRLIWKSLLLLFVLFLLMQLWYLGHVFWWKAFDPASTAFMEAGLERLQEKRPEAELRYRWVDYNRVSMHLKRAVIAAEDSRFLEHEGFDWEGIEKAVEKNLKKGRIVAGGSTISQQLAKNLFLSASRNPFRKLQEAVITVMIETLWSKRRILEVYLNVIEWGNGIYGAEAASRRYFKTSSASLGPDQAAQLAAMIPNPRYYETHRSARGLLRRQGIIAARMYQVSVPR
jgi:monofunctional biosynthetic peptidoglycan transglycosylase